MTDARITAQRLRELLSYDQDTGLFTRLSHGRGRRPAEGRPAGCKTDRGYIHIHVSGRIYKAHRLAWLYVNSEWPDGDIDHIDGDKTNNRINNLRSVSTSVNMQNQRSAQKRNASGFLGVTVHGGRFEASIKLNGKNIYLGSYATPELAHDAYLAKKREIHPGCVI